MESGGFALHCANIRELARQMLMMRVVRGFSMPHHGACPGHNWLTGFLKRHPGNISSFGKYFLIAYCGTSCPEKQESLVEARAMRDSSACIKTPDK